MVYVENLKRSAQKSLLELIRVQHGRRIQDKHTKINCISTNNKHVNAEIKDSIYNCSP